MQLPFYYIYGDDTDMIEKKWLPDLIQKYPRADFLRYDASIDEIPVGKIAAGYASHDLFAEGKVIIIRNADLKQEVCESLATALLENSLPENALVFIAKNLNATTRLGKLAKKSFIVKEFTKPEIKPFDLLDSLNTKNTAKVLHHFNRLQSADYPGLALYSLLCGHFSLLKQIKGLQRRSPEEIARELKQHPFRVKKALVALRYWSAEELDQALKELVDLGELLRTWQYDESLLLQMYLIKLTI